MTGKSKSVVSEGVEVIEGKLPLSEKPIGKGSIDQGETR